MFRKAICPAPLFRYAAILALSVLLALIGLFAARAQAPLGELLSTQQLEAQSPEPKLTRQAVREARASLAVVWKLL